MFKTLRFEAACQHAIIANHTQTDRTVQMINHIVPDCVARRTRKEFQ